MTKQKTINKKQRIRSYRNSMKDVAIKLENVSKKYIIHHEKPTLAEKILNGKDEEFWALKNINIKITSGDRVGVIGPNGSGKTTLLKLITGISTPTTGRVQVKGKIVSIIDAEAGFHPDLTGTQNIFLNGMILGMSKIEIIHKMPEIVKFADIGKFIDVPLYTYSEGMKLRLGFSVAIFSDPDILVLDETITTGDKNFRSKAVAKIQDMFRENKTIIIASHWWEFIRDNCDCLISLDKGRVVHYGDLGPLIRMISQKT